MGIFAMEDEAAFVLTTIEIVEDHIALMKKDRSLWDSWNVDASQTNVIDVGDGCWVTAILDGHESNTIVNPLADWIALWSPGTVQVVLDMMKSHVEGLQRLRELEPDAEIPVSRAVMDMAEKLLNTVISKPVKDSGGKEIYPTRTIGVTIWGRTE